MYNPAKDPKSGQRSITMQIRQRRPSSLVTLAASAAILFPLSGHAVEFTLSGQVNRLLMAVDNGAVDGIVHADNSVSGTRWRIKGQGDIGNGKTAGLYFENQLQSNPSNQVTAASLDTDGTGGNLGGGDNFSVRQANVWVKGAFGKVTIGQGDGAANGSSEADKSGTTVVQYVGSSEDLLGSMEYGTSTVIVGDVRVSFDALSRSDNIRYDGGNGTTTFAASLGNGDKAELGIKYKANNLDFRAGYWNEGDSGTSVSGAAISASWGEETGINFTGSYAGDDSAGDPNNIYLKVGFKTGGSAYAVDFSETTDHRDTGSSDASAISVAWAKNVMKGVEVYASFRIESLDNVADADDITALIGGARVKF
jgi:predicted porin